VNCRYTHEVVTFPQNSGEICFSGFFLKLMGVWEKQLGLVLENFGLTDFRHIESCSYIIDISIFKNRRNFCDFQKILVGYPSTNFFRQRVLCENCENIYVVFIGTDQYAGRKVRNQ
jgi:hypothetical protein